MPLLDHFHPPLHGPRRWEGFHHAWATVVAQQLNQDTLPPDYFAEPEISVGPELEIDVATLKLTPAKPNRDGIATIAWSPPRPALAAKVDFARLDSYEIHVYQNLGGAELRAAIELISPANKDRAASRRTFAAKCASYLKHGIAVVIVDIVTARSANLHQVVFDTLGVNGRRAAWNSPTGLYAVAYRAVTVRKSPRVEAWPERLALGHTLPVMPLWLSLDKCVPLRLEESYLATCKSLRISA
jgi:Protein of unknown function (DUF4058)